MSSLSASEFARCEAWGASRASGLRGYLESKFWPPFPAHMIDRQVAAMEAHWEGNLPDRGELAVRMGVRYFPGQDTHIRNLYRYFGAFLNDAGEKE